MPKVANAHSLELSGVGNATANQNKRDGAVAL